MEPDAYIEERLNGQQKWYSKKSSVNKTYYNRLKISTIIFSVLIPLISGFEKYMAQEVSITVVVGVLGAVVAILTSISGFMKFKEKWINYRTASERLKKEKLLWATKTNPYHKDDAFHLLVGRVEAIISAENGDWGDYIGMEQNSSE